jgi:hypothetical protein
LQQAFRRLDAFPSLSRFLILQTATHEAIEPS